MSSLQKYHRLRLEQYRLMLKLAESPESKQYWAAAVADVEAKMNERRVA